jgi:hypothetical protein
LQLEARGIPLLGDRLQNFSTVISQFAGENGRGYKIATDVYRFVQGEQRKKEKTLIEHPQVMLAEDTDTTAIAPASDSNFIAAVLDLGTYRTGHFSLDIAEAAGDEIIDVIFSEDLDKNQFPLLLGTVEEPTVCQEATALRYRCRPGAQKWESFQYLGFRYAAVIFRNIAKPLKVRHLGLRQVHAAVEPIGKFECSDEKLNQIWKVAANTQLNCAFDALVDCPAREQAQWIGDMRIQSMAMMYAFGDSALHERGIRQVAQSQSADGSLHAHPPADIPGHRLPDFMLSWVGNLQDHYQQTGRLDLVRECLPTMHRLFDFFERHETDGGLLGGFDGFWVFLDWAPLYKADFSAVLNLQYLQALRWASALCKAVGDTAATSRYRKSADALAAEITRHFWDASAKVWRDGFDPATQKPVEAISQHANALAILLQMKPEHDEKIARDILLKSATARRSKIVTASPFFYATVLEAIAHCGLHQEALAVVRDKWGEQIAAGATAFWEKWEPDGSRCHAWSASPLYYLSQWVLGVVPTEPGWKNIRIQPIATKLEFARGVVPSPFGPISIEWERSEDDQLAVHIQIPDGITAQFVGPLGEKRTLEAGSHEFHT